MMNALFPQAHVELAFLNGPLVNKHFLIDRPEIHIGSSSDNDIVIGDQYIFPQHIVINWNNGTFFLRRLDPKSIVKINQRFMQAEWVPFNLGDTISLGQSDIAFCLVANNPVPPVSTRNLSTSPHTAIAPAQINNAALRPTASSASVPLEQTAWTGGGAAHTDTETTRYLCMAARIDQSFRNYVFRNIVGEKHRAIGELRLQEAMYHLRRGVEPSLSRM